MQKYMFGKHWHILSLSGAGLVRGQPASLGVCPLEAQPGHSCLVISDNDCGVSIGHEA